jgi:iron complex transport system substrate-binding protein
LHLLPCSRPFHGLVCLLEMLPQSQHERENGMTAKNTRSFSRQTFWAAAALLVFLVLPLPAQNQERTSRVIALGGDITEIIYALGEESRLVGRDTTSTYPPEAKALPDAGYVRQLGAEGVLSLKPDLVLASAAAGPPAIIDQLRSTGVRVVQLPNGHSADALLQKVMLVADELGASEKGKAFAAALSDRLTKAKAEIASMAGMPRVLFIINSGNGAPLAAGNETAAADLIKLAGGENVFASYSGYKPISLEAAAAANPEAIALMDQSLSAMGGVEGVGRHPALRFTQAARDRRIFGREGSYLLSFGPRLPQAIIDFAKAIRGMGGT